MLNLMRLRKGAKGGINRANENTRHEHSKTFNTLQTAIKRQLEFRDAWRVIACTINRWWEDCPAQQDLNHFWGDFCAERSISACNRSWEKGVYREMKLQEEFLSFTSCCMKYVPSRSFATEASEVIVWGAPNKSSAAGMQCSLRRKHPFYITSNVYGTGVQALQWLSLLMDKSNNARGDPVLLSS